MTLSSAAPAEPHHDRGARALRFEEVRAATEKLVERLSPEDQTIQSMPDSSPAKWHLAHTSWFFETFLLEPYLGGYRVFDPAFRALFNSYYETVGRPFPRARRGTISRPGVAEIADYRRTVTDATAELIWSADVRDWPAVAPLLELGIHHEQQHQELIVMDIKHAFAQNPLRPAYRPQARLVGPLRDQAPPLSWVEIDGGLCEIGADGGSFCFDNETPRHKIWLEPFRLAARPVTNGEYRAFMDDGGYRRPELWLSDGWSAAQAEGWTAPLYWEQHEDAWRIFTLAGMTPFVAAEPVTHVSYYEADAYASWAGKRLATEAEWERAADRFAAGEVWEWTQSAYAPYPGYRAPVGAIGEYNGKFMSGQMVLRGGSAITPAGHARSTYRNFFPPAARWAFSGIRLAETS